ncbi:hypothetical protein FHR70_000655 [Microvirga lupini]|uniref:Uncharacterized protein n=1 Tax=Microvirga lupini TaxID=420324 RepID=A0A7W4YUQ1_9HYPH|nr:hypothetical protein [Microvirga lupini]MBB3017615.1 hypothetical protein [Microvirga lupini]
MGSIKEIDTNQRAFLGKLDELENRAHAVGHTLTSICELSGVARATPDRWRKSTPNTIKLVDKLEAVVVEAEKQAAKAQ